MMKIFWIKQGPLFPLDSGGKIRTWNILKMLAARSELTVLTFFPSYLPASREIPERHLKRFISMPIEMPKKYSIRYRLDYLRKLCSHVPYVVHQYAIPAVREKVRDLLTTHEFDVIVCDFLFPCLNLPRKTSCPQILFAHNAETMIWKRHFEVAKGMAWKAVTGTEYLKLRHFESRRSQTFDHVITVSRQDRDFFAKSVPLSRISVLPTGVDLEYFYPQDAPESPLELVFTGSMDWLANEDAILFFGEKILPLLLGANPGISLTVVGRDPTDKLRRMAKAVPQIRLTGTVDDVRPYIARAAVYVLPLQVGSGTRLKVFEAMAMGKAMVSTQVGVEGLPVAAGQHLLIADEPRKFADAVLRLLRDVTLRRRLGQSARRLVQSSYGWQQITNAFHGTLQQVIKDSPSLTHQNQASIEGAQALNAEFQER
jgi:glycosyltransferase involved in cell wall biosynthesis